MAIFAIDGIAPRGHFAKAARLRRGLVRSATPDGATA
jgi:hypothetical protein